MKFTNLLIPFRGSGLFETQESVEGTFLALCPERWFSTLFALCAANQGTKGDTCGSHDQVRKNIALWSGVLNHIGRNSGLHGVGVGSIRGEAITGKIHKQTVK